jgi:hypothetical protein
MDDARGGADVGVGVARDLFLDEVDEARFALKQTEQLQRAVRRGFDEGGALGFTAAAATDGSLRSSPARRAWTRAANWPSPMIEKKVPKAREILLNKEGLAGFMKGSC